MSNLSKNEIALAYKMSKLPKTYKQPTVRKVKPKNQSVILVMPQYRWSKLKNYVNGSKNLYHNNTQRGLRTVIRLARGQTVQQYFNSHRGFPTAIPIPGLVNRKGPLELGEIRTAKLPSPPKRKTPSPPKRNTSLLPSIAHNTPAAKRILSLNNNLLINQYGSFMINTTIQNLVAKAVTKAKLKEVLAKNLNAGIKKMQAKKNLKTAALNKEREAIVKKLVSQIMKSVTYVKANYTGRIKTTSAGSGYRLRPGRQKNANYQEAVRNYKKSKGYNNITNRNKRAEINANANVHAARVVTNKNKAAGIPTYKPRVQIINNKPKKGPNTTAYKKTHGYTNVQMNALMRAGLVNENNLREPVSTNPRVRPKPIEKAPKALPTELRKYEEPEKKSKPIKVLEPKTTESIIKSAIKKATLWNNNNMSNKIYKSGVAETLGKSRCDSRPKDDLVALMKKYGYTQNPGRFTKPVLCSKLKTIHDKLKGGNPAVTNNNHLKQLLTSLG